MLPKIDYPIHTLQIPSNKKKHNFRPFVVKEEKILLMAKESGEDVDVLTAIKQIVNNCCIDEKFNVNEISTTDLAFLFLRLRSISVNNKVKQTYIDNDDGEPYTFEIDLDKVEVYQERVVSNIIKISKTMGLIMHHPPAKMIGTPMTEDIVGADVIAYCIEKIYENDEIFLPMDYKQKDLIEFVENLPIPALEAINEFLDSAPELRYVIKYKNSLDQDKEIVLRTLADFFEFR